MALTLGDNFSYQGAKPLDGRLKYDTLATMKAVADATMYDGCLAYCTATDKTYQWKASNTVDADTGKWREFTSGGGTEYDDFTGATSEEAGVHGLVPAPAIADREKFLKGDGTWGVVPIPSFDYSNTSPDAMNFSTDEKVIGTWTDGKPLYQKTISTTLPEVTIDGENNAKLVSIGASIDIGFIAGAFFKAINNNYNPIVFVTSAMTRMVNAVVYPNNGIAYQNVLGINCNSIGYSEAPVYFIVRYTKTTDSPVVSGEKIVGQWIDGKPMYEKTVKFENQTLEYNKEYTLVENVDFLVNLSLVLVTIESDGNTLKQPRIVPYLGALNSDYYIDGYFVDLLTTNNVLKYKFQLGSVPTSRKYDLYFNLRYTKT